MAPDEEAFRTLARSSPWLWRTVRFTLHWDGGPHPVRAWVRRPGALRVETLTGELVQTGVESGGATLSSTVTLDADADADADARGPGNRRPGVPDAGPDGLRTTPRAWMDLYEHDAPMYQNYYWVALLDPAELTDGATPDGEPAPGTSVTDVQVVDHHGRPAWEALVRPTDDYEPRCSCCELLPNPVLHARERDNGGIAPEHPPGYTYGEAFRVRVDAGTGICVRLEQVGGTDAGRRHELVLEAVDEPMGDDLFTAPPPRWHERLARFAQSRAPRPGRWAPYE